MKSKGKLANTLFFLSLLCIFVVCSVLVVSYQIGGYHRILTENERIQNECLVSSYLRNQVRFHDEEGKVNVETINGVDVLALHQDKTTSYLYVYDGVLKEFYTTKDNPVILEDGEDLFNVEDMHIKQDNEQLEITLTQDNHVQTVVISSQCKGGDEDA